MSGEGRVLGVGGGSSVLGAATLPNTGNSTLLQVLSITALTLGAVAIVTGIVLVAARRNS